MDYQYRENGARNIFSNDNQMRAYVECSPNQSKKYTLSTFPSSILRNFEDSGICWMFLYLNFTRVLQFSSNSPGLKDGYYYYVYKQTIVSAIRESLSISVGH